MSKYDSIVDVEVSVFGSIHNIMKDAYNLSELLGVNMKFTFNGVDFVVDNNNIDKSSWGHSVVKVLEAVRNQPQNRVFL